MAGEHEQLSTVAPAVPEPASPSARGAATAALASQLGNAAFSASVAQRTGRAPASGARPPGPVDPTTRALARAVADRSVLLRQRASPEAPPPTEQPGPRADPLGTPAVNWDELAAPVMADDEPEAWHGEYPPSPPAVAGPRADPDDVGPEASERFTEVEHAWAGVVIAAVGAWNGAAPAVREYKNAARDADAQGLTGLEGQNWDKPGTPDGDLHKYAEEQTVGADGKKAAVKDLFKPDGADTTASADEVKRGSALDKKLKALLVARKDAVSAAGKLEGQLKQSAALQKDIRVAVLEAEERKAKQDQEKAEGAAAGLKAAQDEAVARVDDSIQVIQGVVGVVAGVAGAAVNEDPVTNLGAAAKEAVGVVGVLIKAAEKAKFQEKIAAAEASVNAAKVRLASVGGDIDATRFDAAVLRFEAHEKTNVAAAQEAFSKAIDDVRDRNDELAEAAGAAAEAGGGDGAQIEAAIKAIPVVELVVAQCQKVTSAATLPGYTHDSGIGFNLAGSPQDFLSHVGRLKGYKARFAAEQKLWTGRLKSLNALVASLYSKAR